MKNRWIQAAAAVAIILAIVGGIKLWTTAGGSGLAFADVLEQIQTRRYAFELTIDYEGQRSPPLRVWIMQPNRMRIDMKEGGMAISSIVDCGAGEALLLFHREKAAQRMKAPGMGEAAGVGRIAALSQRPVENLWLLRDGDQKQLGSKQIDGQPAQGFAVTRRDDRFDYAMEIWAHAKTAEPLLVTVRATSSELPQSIEWTLERFDMRAEPDPSLFGLEVPDGYTLMHQRRLAPPDESAGPAASAEAVKVESVLALWQQDQQEQALDILVQIDWSGPMRFSPESYIFTMKETEYIGLTPADQQVVIQQVMQSGSLVRQITRQAVARGQRELQARRFPQAETYFQGSLQLGRILCRDPEIMLVTRLVGIAVRRLAAEALVDLYRQTGDESKEQQVRQEIERAETELREIKQRMQG
ncbi:MAG: hypothetical protein JW810_04755 [Sedimentisphaerales bacterium]|nr:hypothetical protein [Sedimentisphaerales bacterium]